MSSFFIFVIAVIVFVGAFIASCIKVVSQADLVIVERLGKFHKTLQGGFHVIIPIIDLPKATLSSKEQIIDIYKQQVITQDNVNISVDGLVYLKILNGEMTYYNVEDYRLAISSLAMTTLRGEIGMMNLDDTLSSRDRLNTSLQQALGDAADNWGIKIMRVEISEISVPKEIEDAMNLQMKAERERRAIELKAQAEKEALIRNAEALKQEEVLKAEAIERMAQAKKYEQIALAQGQRNAMENINEAIQTSNYGAEYLLAVERIKAFNELAKSSSKDKVIVPFETMEFIGSLSVIKDFLSKKNG
ncbi:SPFH domain-containing protein [uncultured Campylobacter sp.]|uniref:SPFH domain-containing protein n=1 Tax=uncultured Campylobacter sp. TaxID=218934 RepID=UPI002612A601|nr:SPFH domain-containing protein [uncultured Campylobacter sp.]